MRKMHLALAALALVTFAGTARAQRFGFQLDLGTDTDLGLGVRMTAGMSSMFTSGPMTKSMFAGSFDFFFRDCGPGVSCSYWELNPGIVLPVGNSSLDPYVGGGLTLAHASSKLSGSSVSGSNTRTGINLIGGFHFPFAGLPGFAEARFALGGGEQLVLSAGFMFGR